MTARWLVALLLLATPMASAQVPARDSVRLGALHARALLRDPRGQQLELLAAQARLRQRALDAERRPTLLIESRAQYQSDVARLPITLPGGGSPPTPPHDSYDAHLLAQQKVYDPSLASRRAVDDAQLAESQARVRAALFPLRQAVNDAFFASLRAQSQLAELETGVTDLEAQLRVASARVREGAALPSDENAIRAELLRRRQSIAELRATRHVAIEVLADLTGVPLDSATPFELSDMATDVARVRSSLSDVKSRAEYEQFARSRALLGKQELARAALDKPRVSAFGRIGYGQPGLNPLNDKFDGYWLTGVQLQWTPWNWGATDRDRELLAVQRQIVSAEEQSFSNTLRRAVAQDLAAIDRLAAILTTDDEIIALREDIERELRIRYAEGVVTSADFVDRQTDVLSARISRATHRVELAFARARFLTTLGLEVR